METMKDWNKIPEGKVRIDRDHKRWSRNKKGKNTDDFQESMREDMRGPMEGMEAVPPKSGVGTLQQSESMVNEGGRL